MILTRLRNYLELVRLPGIFTAMADIVAGYLIAGGGRAGLCPLFSLMAASACLYAAGMALNDYFDESIDARHRPGRPIPSGRVPSAAAFFLGFGLLAAGVVLSGAAGSRSFAVALVLAALILSYDAGLKRRPVSGALAMGGCRALNFLLGLSVLPFTGHAVVLPLFTGIYITGVTAFSRGEDTSGATPIQPFIAAGCAILVWAGTAAAAGSPLLPDRSCTWLAALWCAACIRILFRKGKSADPVAVQAAVRQLILMLVILDGILTVGVRGLLWAPVVWVLALLPMRIPKRFYMS